MALAGDKTLADIKAEESIIDKVQWAKDLSIKHKKAVLVAESFAPTTSADWVAVPDNKSDAIDELAGRVMDVEAATGTEVAALVALSGVAADEEDLGAFSGATIADDSTIKEALQALETSVELKASDEEVAALIVLSGVAAEAENLGTFTGTTIPDSSDVKEALQALETEVELKADASAIVDPVPAGNAKGFVKATVTAAQLNAAGTGVAVLAGDAIPVGAYVTRVYFDVTEAFTGNGDHSSTVSIGIQDQAVDVQAAAAVSGAPFDATGLEEGSVGIDGTVAKFVAISASAKQVAVTGTIIATDTAFVTGSVTVYAEYVY